MELKSNKLPKGLVTLDFFFDCDDAWNDKWKFVADKSDYVDLWVSDGRNFWVGKNVSHHDKERLISFCEKYGVVAWSYDDLEGYDPDIIQHTIELTKGAKLVRQKQRPINPKIEALMAQELTKLIVSRIVFPIKHSTWVSNLVLVRNKNGDIHLCVDFQDLNRASLKDHYPLPSMESILQIVAGS